MSIKIAVLAKQVIDPEMPMAAFRIDSGAKKVDTPATIPPVVNGFDENAVEAAMRIKDSQEATVTVISSGTEFALDVMKKPLSMGADELVLLQDDAFDNTVDSFFTARLLAEAVRNPASAPVNCAITSDARTCISWIRTKRGIAAAVASATRRVAIDPPSDVIVPDVLITRAKPCASCQDQSTGYPVFPSMGEPFCA